jgi:radical SAM protein with 4Fe4S-binding SPASM domain
MTGTYLNDDVEIRIEADHRDIARKGVPVFHHLTLGEAIALSTIAKTGSIPKAAWLCEKFLPNGKELVEYVYERYITYFGQGSPRPFPLQAIREIIPELRKRNVESVPSAIPAAPLSVTWYTTYACNRECTYCCYGRLRDYHEAGQNGDSTVSTMHVVDMVHEMASIGTPDLYITGGEPLLRRDLPEIIAEASSVRVRTHLITKFAIDRPLARRLSNARLKSVTVSLDSCFEKELAVLMGSREYLAEATSSIISLLSAGIPVAVNAVVTSVNAESLSFLAEYLIELGVPKLQFSEYTVSDLQLAPLEGLLPGIAVPVIIAELQERYQGKIDIEGGNVPLSQSEVRSSCSICSNGRIGLPVLPHGEATYCPNIHSSREFVFGNITTSKLLEIWTDPTRMKITQPTRDLYAGTACAECSEFNVCNDRGRCYLSALRKYGRAYAPDEFCLIDS